MSWGDTVLEKKLLGEAAANRVAEVGHWNLDTEEQLLLTSVSCQY